MIRILFRSTAIEAWSCTDSRCGWAEELKSVQEEIMTPVPISAFCHHVDSKVNEVKMIPIPNFFDSDVYAAMLRCEFFSKITSAHLPLFVTQT